MIIASTKMQDKNVPVIKISKPLLMSDLAVTLRKKEKVLFQKTGNTFSWTDIKSDQKMKFYFGI